jgi:hypothetical protein
MFDKILKFTGIQSQEDRDAKLYDDLIRHEAQLGGTIFGAVPKGGRREFFCLDQYTWVWHEEWEDKSGQKKSRTTRYNVRPDSIVKIQDGMRYQKISNEEATRFYDAVLAYQKKVKRELYQVA